MFDVVTHWGGRRAVGSEPRGSGAVSGQLVERLVDRPVGGRGGDLVGGGQRGLVLALVHRHQRRPEGAAVGGHEAHRVEDLEGGPGRGGGCGVLQGCCYCCSCCCRGGLRDVCAWSCGGGLRC